MPNNLSFFAIHADDLPRARRFYESVFGWKFQPWGPPGFFLIATGDAADPGVAGALQKRHDVVPGERITGFECTISVANIDTAAAAVVASGGKILLAKCEIPTVGWLMKVQDPEGNVFCVKQPPSETAE
jgi:predicted enzyme related to lactoylglutathione lyase